jgi:hypothetical protein
VLHTLNGSPFRNQTLYPSSPLRLLSAQIHGAICISICGEVSTAAIAVLA